MIELESHMLHELRRAQSSGQYRSASDQQSINFVACGVQAYGLLPAALSHAPMGNDRNNLGSSGMTTSAVPQQRIFQDAQVYKCGCMFVSLLCEACDDNGLKR